MKFPLFIAAFIYIGAFAIEPMKEAQKVGIYELVVNPETGYAETDEKISKKFYSSNVTFQTSFRNAVVAGKIASVTVLEFRVPGGATKTSPKTISYYETEEVVADEKKAEPKLPDALTQSASSDAAILVYAVDGRAPTLRTLKFLIDRGVVANVAIRSSESNQLSSNAKVWSINVDNLYVQLDMKKIAELPRFAKGQSNLIENSWLSLCAYGVPAFEKYIKGLNDPQPISAPQISYEMESWENGYAERTTSIDKPDTFMRMVAWEIKLKEKAEKATAPAPK